MQEARHASAQHDVPGPPSIDRLVDALDQSLSVFSTKYAEFRAGLSGNVSDSLRQTLLDLESDYQDFLRSDDNLKSELAEDKVLNVFKASADQADEMMDSLQKAVSLSNAAADAEVTSSNDVDNFRATLRSYEQKKKFYLPSVAKSLAVLERSIKSRTTRNGEVSRRHAEVSERFTALREAMVKLDRGVTEMKNKWLEAEKTLRDQPEMLTDEIDEGLALSALDIKGMAPRRAMTPTSLRRPSASSSLSNVTAASFVGRQRTLSAASGASSPPISMRPGGYFLPSPPPTTSHRPVSPSPSDGSLAASTNSRRRSMIPVRTPTASPSSRSVSVSQVARPPMPPMPSQDEIQAKEARLNAYLRSSMQTPEPMLRERAARMPFYAARATTASRSRTTSYNGMPSAPAYAAMTPSRFSTGGTTPSRQPPPSSFRSPTPSRPSSSASHRRDGRAGAQTPAPAIRDGPFVPNKLDALDVELARVLHAVPNDVHIQRLSPPLLRGQRHEGTWEAQYALTSGRAGRKEHLCKLLELDKGGTKTNKVMIRVGGGEQSTSRKDEDVRSLTRRRPFSLEGSSTVSARSRMTQSINLSHFATLPARVVTASGGRKSRACSGGIFGDECAGDGSKCINMSQA